MIYIKEKKKCCGCAACVQICPQQCISFEEDNEGFKYPIADKNKCLDCGLCEIICPSRNHNDSIDPLHVYVAINPNEEIRIKSSSGGIFTLLAEAIIEEGGVVFGARFDDDWEVVHDYTETREGIACFRGSKYLQSRIENSYKQTRQFLDSGRKVLFTGTGCQIAGLKRFLRKEYKNLLTLEIVCHSVPSPKVWRHYLKELSSNSIIKNINFRNKNNGWKNYSILIETESGYIKEKGGNIYMKGLVNNLTTRPSCEQCPAKIRRSGADIVIGDCWGIWDIYPELDDDKGMSLVETLTLRGSQFFNSLKLEKKEITLNQVLMHNKGLQGPSPISLKHNSFFRKLEIYPSTAELINRYTKSNHNKLLWRISKIIRGIIISIKPILR